MTSIERAYQWKEEGRIHVSPHEAAEVLDADPYTLNICARVQEHRNSGGNQTSGVLRFPV